MKDCMTMPADMSGTIQDDTTLARSLLTARGHFGRLTRLRKAPRSALHGKRWGIDLINLLESTKNIAQAQSMLSGMNPADIAFAARGREAIHALEDSWAPGLGSAVAIGRWKPGSLTNRQCGEWAGLPLSAFIAVGDHMEIALREARSRGAFCIWIADTHCDDALADVTIRLNTRSADALQLTLASLDPRITQRM